MRILFWTDGFWPRLGGIETAGLEFVLGMQARGHEILVIAQKDTPHEPTYPGLTIKRFDFALIATKRDLQFLRPIEATIEWALKEFRAETILLNACVGWSSFVFSLFRKRFNIPVVLTVHSPLLANENPLFSLQKLSEEVDQIYCVSKWVLRETEKQVPHAKHKLRLVYNGLSWPKTPPSPLPFSPPTLILLGRMTSEKGFDMAIRAFALLKAKGSVAKLLIGGEGPERTTLEKLSGDDVYFTGEIQRGSIPEFINRGTLVLVPSYFESFGLVALEAMQMGRPVIASSVGGLPEIIVDQETGVLVPPKDPLALANAIQTLLNHPEKMIEMGQKGRLRASSHFTLEQNLTAYEKLTR